MTEGFRVTYATLSSDDDDLHADFDRGIAAARNRLGKHHPFVVDGEQVDGEPGRAFEERSPIDRDMVIGTFATASEIDVHNAVTVAREGAMSWAATPWRERVAVLRRAADLISARRCELAAMMTMEVGKNRLESLGDVEESADLIRYYCHQMGEHNGFEQPMQRLSDREATSDAMRPYGVWAVISPFNYPMALSAGPLGAALCAGNAAVLKPAEQGVLTGLDTVSMLHDVGVPSGALHVVTGPGETVGAALVADDRVGGVTFTGSCAVGMHISRSFAHRWPKPAICEMGGKNPVIVSRNADLDMAAEGTLRSAFGLSGQKCSAASRCYVERGVYDDFLQNLIARTNAVEIGNPLDRGVYLGPVIDEAAVGRYCNAIEHARSHGRVLAGGEVVKEGDLARGHFVQPAIVEVPDDSYLWTTEVFVPLIAVRRVDSIDEAIDRANDVTFGLTAGMFSADESEVERFLDLIEAGVVYVNRRAGATTGAWPGVQPFGGWKASGTGGKSGGGPYYLQQYLREQSRTVVEP